MSLQTLQLEEATLRAEPEFERRESRRVTLERWLCVRFIARPSYQPHQAIVLNISRRGMGLIVHEPMPPGTVIAVMLRSRHMEFLSILTAQVCHATWRAADCWLIGCQLRKPLDDEVVRLLIGDDVEDFDLP
jgi:hypothetical protein